MTNSRMDMYDFPRPIFMFQTVSSLQNPRQGNDGYFSLCHRIQIGSRAHPSSYSVVPGVLTEGVKRPGRKAGNSSPPSAEVKDAWSYTFTPPIHLHRTSLLPLPFPTLCHILSDLSQWMKVFRKQLWRSCPPPPHLPITPHNSCFISNSKVCRLVGKCSVQIQLFCVCDKV
jgi:hypothetical protein